MIDESQMTLGRDWRGEDLRGWLVSEKLNGCRAYWDGAHLWTRGGNIIAAPPSFTRELPKGLHLDGEIWCGRGQQEAARWAVQYGNFTGAEHFVVFDAPEARGTWQQRIAEAGRLWRDVVRFEVCQSRRWLMERLRDVQAGGGEGLVARNPIITSYEVARTANFLKIKKPLFVKSFC